MATKTATPLLAGSAALPSFMRGKVPASLLDKMSVEMATISLSSPDARALLMILLTGARLVPVPFAAGEPGIDEAVKTDIEGESSSSRA